MWAQWDWAVLEGGLHSRRRGRYCRKGKRLSPVETEQEPESIRRKSSGHHGSKSKSQAVLGIREEPRVPGTQAGSRGHGKEQSMLGPDKPLGPKSAQAVTGKREDGSTAKALEDRAGHLPSPPRVAFFPEGGEERPEALDEAAQNLSELPWVKSWVWGLENSL